MIESTMDNVQQTDFITWLMSQARRDDLVGDLAVDIRIDMDMECLDSTITTAEELREHVLNVHEVDEHVVAFIDYVGCEYLVGGDASNYEAVFTVED